MRNDDNDVKIFGAKTDPETEDLHFIEEMNHQRANGNTALAKQLGNELADFLMTKTGNGGDSFFPRKMNTPAPEVLYRMRELAVFCAEHRLETLMNNQLLCATAVNSFYDSLIKLEPDFYEKVSAGTAFTFYCLDIREKSGVAEKIGQSFAMLCGDESSEEYISVGAESYNTACYETEKIFKKYTFAE